MRTGSSSVNFFQAVFTRVVTAISQAMQTQIRLLLHAQTVAIGALSSGQEIQELKIKF